MMLGDLGADVIKVERPGAGDESRGWGPPFDARGESAYYLSINRNKLGIALDLRLPDDQALAIDLALQADVVIDNFSANRDRAPLLDRDDLLVRNDRLIWVTITGFGADSSRLGYDLVVQAESGWMAITGEPDGRPMKVGVALADVVAGKDAAATVLAALVARQRSTKAPPASDRRFVISLAQSAVSALVNVAQNVLVSGRDAGRYGNAHPNLVPYQSFQASDGHIVIAVGNDDQWQRCCAALGLDSLGSDAALATNRGRLKQRDRVVEAIARRVASEPAALWVQQLAAAKVPSGVVRSVKEALGDVATSALSGIAPAIPGSVRYPPPLLDEHGAGIRQLGWAVFDQRK
jgi:crotonobetainyl-CoA:carnitine CoA-transferase CaiB-like acyl-CoA transferase